MAGFAQIGSDNSVDLSDLMNVEPLSPSTPATGNGSLEVLQKELGKELFGGSSDGSSDSDDGPSQSQQRYPAALAQRVHPVQQAAQDEGMTLEGSFQPSQQPIQAHGMEGQEDFGDYGNEDYGGPAPVQTEFPLQNHPIPPPTSKVWYVRPSPFIAIEKKAFDPTTWETPEEVEERQKREAEQAKKEEALRKRNESADQDSDDSVDALDAVRAARAKAAKVAAKATSLPSLPLYAVKEKEPEMVAKPIVVPDENVVRWMWVEDENGKPVRRSNARFIRWSDGSRSLQIGDQHFEVSETGNALNYLVHSHTVPVRLTEAHAPVHGTLSFRPPSLQSASHQRFVNSIQGRYRRDKAIKSHLTERDPEQARRDAEKKELEDERKKNKKKSDTEETKPRTRSEKGKGKRRAIAVGVFSSDEDEEDERERAGGK